MGIWIVQPDDLDAALSEHTNETEAERAAIARAVALDDAAVVIHDRYTRVRIVHPAPAGRHQRGDDWPAGHHGCQHADRLCDRRRARRRRAERRARALAAALAVIRWLFANDKADQAFLALHTTGADELRRRAEAWTLERAAEVTVSAPGIEAFARLYAETRPAVIRCGWGLERNRNGGRRRPRCSPCPPWRERSGSGGGYTLSNSAVWDLNTSLAAAEPEPPTRPINMNELGAVSTGDLQPPVKALFVYDCNPLMTLPAQQRVRAGLRREDLFTVVFDQVLTDTARYADVILPAARTYLERREIARGYGADVLQDRAPVIAPVGEFAREPRGFRGALRANGRRTAGRPHDHRGIGRCDLPIERASGRDPRGTCRDRASPFPRPAPDPSSSSTCFRARPTARCTWFRPTSTTKRRRASTPSGRRRGDRFPSPSILALDRQDDQSTLGESRAAARSRGHPSRRCRGAGNLLRATVCGFTTALGEVRCRVAATATSGRCRFPAQGPLEPQHGERDHVQRAVPREPTDLGGGACFNDARIEVERVSR